MIMKQTNFYYRSIISMGVLALLLASGPESLLAEAEKGSAKASLSQRLDHYNLQDGSVALSGYDPVSYFDGGPRKGNKSLKSRHQGVNYYFATEANQKMFEADPEKYEPAYGGWCSWAMYKGSKYEVDPENYKIINGRNLLFYKGWKTNTLDKWNKLAEKKGDAPLLRDAGANWQKTIAD